MAILLPRQLRRSFPRGRGSKLSEWILRYLGSLLRVGRFVLGLLRHLLLLLLGHSSERVSSHLWVHLLLVSHELVLLRLRLAKGIVLLHLLRLVGHELILLLRGRLGLVHACHYAI